MLIVLKYALSVNIIFPQTDTEILKAPNRQGVNSVGLVLL
ncbi:hypothetical protein ASZ90_019248 [hydrocarbon metagenome]|uniref:Uncharacterized protein n=1 Tax=hydrocarbon metagenome TaxID=938273 RepID=A0A0W8E437_9ZZZZ